MRVISEKSGCLRIAVISLLRRLRDKIRLVGAMESSRLELELVGELDKGLEVRNGVAERIEQYLTSQ